MLLGLFREKSPVKFWEKSWVKEGRREGEGPGPGPGPGPGSGSGSEGSGSWLMEVRPKWKLENGCALYPYLCRVLRGPILYDRKPVSREDYPLKTKARKPLPVEDQAATPAEEVKTAPPEGPKVDKPRLQFSFDLNEDGSPDLSTMRDSTKKRVIEFYNDPRMSAAFGVRVASNPEVQVFHPAMISGLYDLLGAVEAAAVERFLNIPQPICKQVFTYTPAEKTALEGPTVRVLNKYAAQWMIKYQDEIALAGLLLSLTIAKVNAARMLARTQASNIREMPRQEKNPENEQKEGVN